MKKRILITGGTGFLGRHLCQHLIKTGNYELMLLVRQNTKLAELKELKNLSFFDIESKALAEVFHEQKWDAVLHLATEYGRGDSKTMDVLKANLIFPIELMKLCIHNKIGLFVNTDSYFNKDDFSYDYLLDYSLSKKSFLYWLKRYSKHIRVANLVLEHIYGPEDKPEKFVSSVTRQIAVEKKQSIDLTGGQQKRDFVYVSDVCNAFEKVLENGFSTSYRYRDFNVGTGVATSIAQFVATIKSLSKSPTHLNFGSIPYREDEIMCSSADTSCLRDIGWRAEYSIEDGIRKILSEQNLIGVE